LETKFVLTSLQHYILYGILHYIIIITHKLLLFNIGFFK